MGLFLKQNQAVDVIVGPFLDDTDGKTAENALTINAAEVFLSKNGGALAAKNEGTALANDSIGYYDCNLNGTDTNTLGRLQLMVHEAGALPVYHEYMVVTANYYDSICGADTLQADLTQMGGVAQSATDLKDFADAGYDPANNKVTAVLLCDQTTLVDGVTLCDQTTLVDGVTLCDRTTLVDTVTAADQLTNGGFTDLLIDAIKAKTDNLPVDPADDSDIDAAIAAIPAQVWAVALEGALTAKEQMNINHAVLAGKSNGGGTATIKFRNAADGGDRMTATVTAVGDRTNVVTDGS